MHYLVTGSAGLIGFHVAERLLKEGHSVVGLDNFNSYYDPKLKEARTSLLTPDPSFKLVRGNLENTELIGSLFENHPFDCVIHMAAQAGVRYSLENPHVYAASNLTGFVNILEVCRRHQVKHLVYASSSSVYGGNQKMPFSEKDPVDHPISLYAATKRANELMAHAYAHLFGLPCTGLRFFTVYGPWGRPDMAFMQFAEAIMRGKPISVFNHGNLKRDFTYIDDAVDGVLRAAAHIPAASPEATSSSAHAVIRESKLLTPNASWAPFQVFNLGNHQPISVLRVIELLEAELGKTAIKTMLPMQPGDVEETFADLTESKCVLGYEPKISIEEGTRRFAEWQKTYWASIGAL